MSLQGADPPLINFLGSCFEVLPPPTGWVAGSWLFDLGELDLGYWPACCCWCPCSWPTVGLLDECVSESALESIAAGTLLRSLFFTWEDCKPSGSDETCSETFFLFVEGASVVEFGTFRGELFFVDDCTDVFGGITDEAGVLDDEDDEDDDVDDDEDDDTDRPSIDAGLELSEGR